MRAVSWSVAVILVAAGIALGAVLGFWQAGESNRASSAPAAGIEVRLVNYREDDRGLWIQVYIDGRPELGDHVSTPDPPLLIDAWGLIIRANESTPIGDNWRHREFLYENVPMGGKLSFLIQRLEFYDEQTMQSSEEVAVTTVDGAWAVHVELPLRCPDGWSETPDGAACVPPPAPDLTPAAPGP